MDDKSKSRLDDRKTLLVTMSNSFFVRNFLRTDAYEFLKSHSSYRLVFLAPRDKIEYYREQFRDPHTVFDVLPEAKSSRLEHLFKFLETSSIHTNTVWTLNKSEFGKSEGKSMLWLRVATFGLRSVFWFMGKWKWWRMLIRKVYRSTPSHLYQTLFKTYEPDVVFCPSMVYEDCVLLKEAKAAGRKTVGMVLSWDNLYSKTFLRVHPDTLVVHTRAIRDQAVYFGDYPAENIEVLGIPQYDRYFKKEGIVPRAEFLRALGGDPTKRLILYAFSGKAGLHVDFDMVGILSDFLKEGKMPRDVQVLVRPYPRYDLPPDRLKYIREEYQFLAEPAMAHVGGGKTDWEFDERSLWLLVNSLAHADVVITMYSTFFIEGAIFDKPLIGVAFDGGKKLPYWNSVSRFFVEWDHLRDLDRCGGITLVRNKDEFLSAIITSLNNPWTKQEGRRSILEEEVNFFDGASGRRLASLLMTRLDQ